MVTLEHLSTVRGFSSRPGFCRGKSRAWFKRHGLDWHAFRHGGLPASEFLSTGCALAKALVEHAQEVERGRK
jgi:hypothetical protein